MCPLDDLNRIDGRWFHLGVKHNEPVERHLPVFNHRRDSRQKQPLLGRVKTIPAREIQAFTGRFTSVSTIHDAGARSLYQGQRVFSEWQLEQA
jgi:hypothetical protein